MKKRNVVRKIKSIDDLNKIRKVIWERKGAVDAKMTESGFDALTADVQDAADGLGISLVTNVSPVCIAREKVLGKSRLDDLRSREIVRIAPASVKRLVRTMATDKGTQSSAVLYDRVRHVWNVESADESSSAGVNAENIEKVLSAINPLEASRVETLRVSAADLDNYGLGHPVFSLAVDLDQDRSVRRNILVGSATKGGRFVTVGSSDAVFVVSDDVFEALSMPLLER